MTLVADEVIGAIPVWIDIVSVAVAALPGALIAARVGFDINGVLVLAILNGVGGGMIRDTLIQQGTPVGLTSPWLLPTAAAVGLAGFVAAGPLDRLHVRLGRLILVLDSVVLGVISIAGAAKAIDAGLPGPSCVFVGVLAGVGGALLRDVLVNEQPELLRPGTYYATIAAIGTTLLVIAVRLLDLPPASGAVLIVLVVALRLLAVWRGWESAAAVDVVLRPRFPSRRRR